ncbi:uncharacterized protein LOC133822448 [Humulus lupulus]|uniref:uncharacterized protein LOC133822448 n=1 Tax=Humulus lupulus TaxID=3486 RepID=UPI002B40120E|nr:uncharacterized protein LOC133822448 [Humulus lupulus]
MKIKSKGKVYPSPNPSSSSNDREVLSVLKLLPAAILALASVLSLEDKEVLAYMITRSMKTSFSSSSSSVSQESKKKSSKKGSSNNNNNGHKTPMFDCDCFDCYTSYWFRWDSSPNRELIHQVIEAFEDHLTHGEKSKKNNGRGKRRDKLGRRDHPHLVQNPLVLPDVPSPQPPLLPVPEEKVQESQSPPCAVILEAPLKNNEELKEENENDTVEDEQEQQQLTEVSDAVAVAVRTMTTANDHKGLARKVLPDVLGLLNSRLWSLWSPNA